MPNNKVVSPRREYHRQWNLKHGDRLKEKRRFNAESKKAYDKKYYETHKEEILCKSKERHEKLYKNPEYRRVRLAKQRQQYKELRQQVYNVLGEICCVCGFSDKRALQVDHINGGGNRERATLGSIGLLMRIIKHPKDYQMLCANCNRIKSFSSVIE